MSDLTRSSDAGLEGNSGFNKTPQTRQAGVGIAAGEACYIDSNGLFQKAVSTVWMVTGTTGQIAFDGLAAKAIPSGTFGEIYGAGAEFFYADSGLTIGTALWVSNTAGKLADARVAAAGTDQPVAQVITATNIVLLRGL